MKEIPDNDLKCLSIVLDAIDNDKIDYLLETAIIVEMFPSKVYRIGSYLISDDFIQDMIINPEHYRQFINNKSI